MLHLDDNVWSRRYVFIALMLLIYLVTYTICMPIFAYADNGGIELFVLMYHNVVDNRYKDKKYEIREETLRRDLEEIATLGYKVVSPTMLHDYVKGKIRLPKKVVMLTFDDGYYSYIRHLLPLLERYDMTALVNVVGEYTKYNKTNPDTSPKYRYLDYEDIAVLRDSGRVEIGLHSYAMHHIRGGVQGVGQRKGESDSDYEIRLLGDTDKLISGLKNIGVKSFVYAYPYGSYSRASDKILSKRGITMTLSCNEGVNRLSQGSSLYSLKRYNRDGTLSSLKELSPFFSSK